jgi:hypothetical protein
MDARTIAIKTAIEKMVLAIRPILNEVFEAGQVENMAAIQRAMATIGSFPQTPPVSPPSGTALGTSSKDGRAPRGAVRLAVMKVLRAYEPRGATMNEIITAIDSAGTEVSGVSARNELNRKKGVLYAQSDNGEWSIKPGAITQTDEAIAAEADNES